MDLKQMFGSRYVVTLDESWDAETPEYRAEFLAQGLQWWYYEIKGRKGTLSPYNASEVAVTLPTRSALGLMKAMGKVLVRLQHADDGMTFKAELVHAAAILRFIKPRSTRRITEAHKVVLAARLAEHRFKRGQIHTQAERLHMGTTPLLQGVVSETLKHLNVTA